HAEPLDFAFSDVADLEGAWRIHEAAAAPGRTGQEEVARLQREVTRTEREQLGDAEEHLPGRGVLQHLAVHSCAERQHLRIRDLVRRHDDGTKRTKRVEALAARPLALGALNVSRGDA